MKNNSLSSLALYTPYLSRIVSLGTSGMHYVALAGLISLALLTTATANPIFLVIMFVPFFFRALFSPESSRARDLSQAAANPSTIIFIFFTFFFEQWRPPLVRLRGREKFSGLQSLGTAVLSAP